MSLPMSATLAAAAVARAREQPDKPAVRCEGRSLTYGDLNTRSNRIGHALRSAGIRPGSRVGYLARESEHYYTTIIACAKVGAVLVPVNWRLTAGEVQHILRDSSAELLFVEDEFLALVEAARAELPLLRAVVTLDGGVDHGEGLRAWYGASPASDPDQTSGPDDAVVQIYTSGTTGLPKGVVIAHRSFFTLPPAVAAAGGSWIEWRRDDVNLISLPGLGIAGIGWFMHGFVAGATNVVMRMYEPTEAVHLIHTLGVTTTFAAPAMLQMMLAVRGATQETFASMRTLAYGAAPISESLLVASLDVFDCDLVQIYSSTEAGSVAVCLPAFAHRPGSPLLGAAGLPCPGNEIAIIDQDGEVLPPGETGQVCIRTPARMLGYWNQPDATARTIVDGWLRMGDMGYLDDDGYLFLRDRINDTIIVGGQNIYPAEVERQLADHPDVADVAVVGVADSPWGDSVHACVVLAPGRTATSRQLMVFLRGRLADYKIPTSYHVVDALPRNPGGKILRRLVREDLAARATSRTTSA